MKSIKINQKNAYRGNLFKHFSERIDDIACGRGRVNGVSLEVRHLFIEDNVLYYTNSSNDRHVLETEKGITFDNEWLSLLLVISSFSYE